MNPLPITWTSSLRGLRYHIGFYLLLRCILQHLTITDTVLQAEGTQSGPVTTSLEEVDICQRLTLSSTKWSILDLWRQVDSNHRLRLMRAAHETNSAMPPYERVIRIELTFPAWQAGALTVVLYPHNTNYVLPRQML